MDKIPLAGATTAGEFASTAGMFGAMIGMSGAQFQPTSQQIIGKPSPQSIQDLQNMNEQIYQEQIRNAEEYKREHQRIWRDPELFNVEFQDSDILQPVIQEPNQANDDIDADEYQPLIFHDPAVENIINVYPEVDRPEIRTLIEKFKEYIRTGGYTSVIKHISTITALSTFISHLWGSRQERIIITKEPVDPVITDPRERAKLFEQRQIPSHCKRRIYVDQNGLLRSTVICQFENQQSPNVYMDQ